MNYSKNFSTVKETVLNKALKYIQRKNVQYAQLWNYMGVYST